MSKLRVKVFGPEIRTKKGEFQENKPIGFV